MNWPQATFAAVVLIVCGVLAWALIAAFGAGSFDGEPKSWSGCRQFTPQPDISALELATILKHTSGAGGLKYPVCFKSGAFEALDPSIKRHFAP